MLDHQLKIIQFVHFVSTEMSSGKMTEDRILSIMGILKVINKIAKDVNENHKNNFQLKIYLKQLEKIESENVDELVLKMCSLTKELTQEHISLNKQ